MLGGSLYLPQKENMDGGSADMTEKTQKLKPCPFCGGKAEASEVRAGDFNYSVVTCGECWAKSPHHVWRQDAIAAWNRRAPQCEKE